MVTFTTSHDGARRFLLVMWSATTSILQWWWLPTSITIANGSFIISIGSGPSVVRPIRPRHRLTHHRRWIIPMYHALRIWIGLSWSWCWFGLLSFFGFLSFFGLLRFFGLLGRRFGRIDGFDELNSSTSFGTEFVHDFLRTAANHFDCHCVVFFIELLVSYFCCFPKAIKETKTHNLINFSKQRIQWKTKKKY